MEKGTTSWRSWLPGAGTLSGEKVCHRNEREKLLLFYRKAPGKLADRFGKTGSTRGLLVVGVAQTRDAIPAAPGQPGHFPNMGRILFRALVPSIQCTSLSQTNASTPIRRVAIQRVKHPLKPLPSCQHRSSTASLLERPRQPPTPQS